MPLNDLVASPLMADSRRPRAVDRRYISFACARLPPMLNVVCKKSADSLYSSLPSLCPPLDIAGGALRGNDNLDDALRPVPDIERGVLSFTECSSILHG